MARISKQKQEEVRKSIIQAAKTYFYEDGYEKTSTKKIAKHVGIAEGTIFNYFPSKADLFFETIRQDYLKNYQKTYQYEEYKSDISDVIVNYIFKTIGFMLKLPKRILLELFVAAMKMGKKHPARLKKLAELDFQYMEILKEFLDSLVQKDMIKAIDTKQMSEIIFGALMFELTMYLYESSRSRDEFKQCVRTKIKMIVSGVIKGGIA